jgi:hypothetical protein
MPFDPSGLSDDELSAKHTEFTTRGTELAAKEELSDEEAAELLTLTEDAEAAEGELSSRADRAAKLSASREKFAAKAPEAPVVEAVPDPEPVAVEPTAVQKSTESVAVPSVSELAKSTPQMPATRKSGAVEIAAFVSSDAAGHVGKRSGEEFSGLTEISETLIKTAQQYGRTGGGAGSRHAIAQFRRDRGAEFTVTRPEDTMKVLQHARSEKRLHGGSLAMQWQHNIDSGASLTAAAGWCAPSENLYDVCRQWGTGVGLLDLPTITAARGGINYTDEPSFATIYAAAAATLDTNFLTEAEVIVGTAKECVPVPCPTFEDRRLDVLALCIRVSFLQAVGYPELVNTWVDGLMEANAQEMNRIIIADMIARAGAATPFENPASGTETDSFTSALLAAAELAAEDIRYREGMPFNATIEIVYPHWVLPQIRADLSRRTRDSLGMLSVSDSEIASMFSARNIRVQFVRGYQDGLITGTGTPTPTYPGGIAAPPYLDSLPTTVGFLAYPAGAVAVARQDVVNLTNVYDAASLATNEFTRLFAEEGFAPIYPCPGLRQYTVAGCNAGVVGAAVTSCTAPAV